MLALVTAAIVYGSLYPWRFDFSRGHANPLWILLHAWPHGWNRFVGRDAAFNIVLYAPFGAAAFRSLARRMGTGWAMPGAVALATALSATMEMLQIYGPGRDCNLLDVVCNTIGGAAGALAVAAWRAELERRMAGIEEMPRRRNAGAILLLTLWAGYQWYPFFPALGRTSLAAAVSALFHAHQFRPVELWDGTAEWFAAAVLLESCWPEVEWSAMALFLAACMARLLIHGRGLTAEEVAGAAAALWLWLASRKQRRPALASGMLGVAILLRELEPFRFTSSPAPFGWIPFAASITADRQAALITLCRKAFDYGGILWLFHRRGVRYRISGPVLAGALLAAEWLQRYIPGHIPETADPVLAAILAGILGALASRDDIHWQAEL